MSMIGLAVGILAGAAQFWLLATFAKRLTSGAGINLKAVLLVLLQLLLPLAVLIAVGFLRRGDLLMTAVGIVGALLIGAFVKFGMNARKSRGHRDNND
jgi:hypothetical protein